MAEPLPPLRRTPRALFLIYVLPLLIGSIYMNLATGFAGGGFTLARACRSLYSPLSFTNLRAYPVSAFVACMMLAYLIRPSAGSAVLSAVGSLLWGLIGVAVLSGPWAGHRATAA